MFEQLLDQAQSAEARYLQHSDLTGLDDSITAWERILQHPDFATVDTNFRLEVLNNSAITYWCRYGASGEVADLDRALSGLQEAVRLTPEGSPNLPAYLNNQGLGLLRDRYARTGNLTDLQAGIAASQRSVQLTPEGSSDLPSRLNNLGIGLTNRYARTGAVVDLEEGIKCYQQAVTLTPPDSPDLPSRLNNLGTGLKYRYARTDAVRDLEEGIKCYQQAVTLTPPDSPDLPSRLNNLGTGLKYRYARTDAVRDLEEEIKCYQQALTLTPPDSPDLPSCLNNLGIGLTNHYARTGAMGDLKEGIKCYQQAVTLTPPNSPELPSRLNNLGTGLGDRYARTGDLTDLQAGIEAFQQAAQRGLEVALEESLRSACNWLHWAFGRQAWEEVGQAYSDYAYQAGQGLLKSQLLRAHKESWLKDMQGLASQAAYAFTQLNQLEKAVVTLERGIAILLSEVLRRNRDNLRQLITTGHTDLYDRYQEIVGRYHWAQQQQKVDALRTAQADLDKTIEDIRQVPGYENFLKPVEFDLIQKAAQETPLVYLLTTSAGGLALIVHQKTVTPVELPKFTDEALTQKRISYFTAYDNQQQNRQAWHQAIDDIGQWLWQVLWQPLREKLPNQQRITLIPVGWLNLLPLHAAWTEDPTGRRYYALDEVTIAYAPNAVSLQKARDLATHIQSDKLLAIDEPKPVTANPLPSSSVEVNAIARHFTQPQLLRHHAATQETVKNTLNLNYNVLHFSCHGKAKANPLETGLLMANDQMLTVQHFLDAKLQARLATLSACETGMIGTKNIEEVVGLPASLLQAGVAGVVASLWSVNDLSTALLMIKFYECFFQNPSDTAVALRTAQCWLRDATKEDLLTWANKLSSLTLVEQLGKDEDLGLFESDGKPYTRPYYWSAFYATGQ